MGLGKTLQVLACLSALRAQGRHGPHLVLAPVALLQNWCDEADRFFPGVFEPKLIAHGDALPRSHAAAVAELSRQALVLVSYDTLRRAELTFAHVDWDFVITDEAQRIKNPGTQTARVARTLKARFRLAMTGTPVENSLSELWAIYDWAVPGLLGSLSEFKRTTIDPLAGCSEDVRRQLASRLQDTLAPVFLRRMKSQVLADLPPKSEHPRHVDLSAEQQLRYGQTISARKSRTLNPLEALHRLLCICAHPALLDDEPELPPADPGGFPKADEVLALLADIASRGEKVLVFAKWRRVQRWLSAEITHRHGVPVPIINGEITGSQARLRIVQRFEQRPGFAALVLSPRAAGVGLNITAANHVLHYTREWNPAIESQATDRAYRLGQTRDVFVHTVTCRSAFGTTVEQRLVELLDRKRALMDDFVVPLGGFEITANELIEAADV
jgi:SNF2 family DNA or RNA helicase